VRFFAALSADNTDAGPDEGTQITQIYTDYLLSQTIKSDKSDESVERKGTSNYFPR
jgi:hypothetical protein